MATSTTPKATLTKVVSLRDKKGLSWVTISKEMGLNNARAAVRLYDKALGKGAHYESHPLPGGRRRVETNGSKPSSKGKAVPKATAKNTKAIAAATKSKRASKTTAARPARKAVKATEDNES